MYVVGNTLNLPEYYDAHLLTLNDAAKPYIWTPQMIDWFLANPDKVKPLVKGQVYDYFKDHCGGVLTDTVVYPNQMNAVQQTVIHTANGCPDYPNLPHPPVPVHCEDSIGGLDGKGYDLTKHLMNTCIIFKQ